ncbi:MAG: hypothetical protein KDH17_03380 [Rhodocyclaceae bacterium]|nr:hypothetical protein [Rhodocyclaceae bacterium]
MSPFLLAFVPSIDSTSKSSFAAIGDSSAHALLRRKSSETGSQAPTTATPRFL